MKGKFDRKNGIGEEEEAEEDVGAVAKTFGSIPFCGVLFPFMASVETGSKSTPEILDDEGYEDL